MKIYDIISESTDLDEAPASWVGQKLRGLGAKMGSRTAATTRATGDEANELKRELKAWMAGSRIGKGQLTADDLETYLDQKGYGGLAADALALIRKKDTDAAAAKAAKAADRSAKIQAVGYKAGQAVGAAGKAAGKAGQAIKNLSGVTPAGQVSEAAPADAPLTNPEIDKVLMAVVAKAYKTGAGFEKGRFGKDKPASAPAGSPPAASGATGQPVDLNAVDPKDARLIMMLKQRGYNVVK
jgi:hypothetical protein